MKNLKKFREKNCLSQRRLSEITGVNLRMIQFYETGFKNINHAHADTILTLANIRKIKNNLTFFYIFVTIIYIGGI